MGPGLSKADSALHVWRSKLRSRAVPKGSDCPTQRSPGPGPGAGGARAELSGGGRRGGGGGPAPRALRMAPGGPRPGRVAPRAAAPRARAARAGPRGDGRGARRSGGAGSAAAAEIFWRSSRGRRGARSCRPGVRLTRVDVCRVRERENEPRGELVRERPWASPDPGRQREKVRPTEHLPGR
ncbi:PREDICTED: serine/arginine repetitive matrix protein 3-like [Capra hircus]|uniref:serine/arginine repetitive matrix protein 3-like n=1 Tax=Capra hircus TaxID=9925 RepID=UPI00084771E4|nr:PREDICTED: serine/arginine repetitive matrix protein 3-like [Capra hircus]